MKTLKIAAVTAGILLLAGCGNQIANNNQNQSSEGGQKQQKEMEQEKSGMISSIQEAMGLGKTMRCTYRVKSGNQNMEMVTYVEGKKYRTEMNMGGVEQLSVFDGEAMYSWGKGEKTGRKMTQKCMEELGQNASKNTEEDDMSFSARDNNFENALDVKCEEISDADFSISSDVVFTDQCEEMKKMMEDVQNMNINMNQNGAPNMPKGMEGMPELVP